MEQKQNPSAPGAATDEPASPFNSSDRSPSAIPGDPPAFAEPPLFSDTLGDYVDERLEETLAETFPPGCRKPRHDGWGPVEVGAFLRTLAATGVVEAAARSVGRSAQSAYTLRNSRQGRAFAKMWDAVLIHRTRARVASELSGRSIAGCVSVRKKDGVVVSEYHYYDNRLAMALLTRLDRLAEKEAASEAHLRALSEDLDDYIDCIAAGGDAEAFVEERRPAEPAAPEEPEDGEPDDDPQLTTFARLSGCDDYRGVPAAEIPVLDLDPAARGDWDADQWVRAYRSGFMVWLEPRPGGVEGAGPDAPYRFYFLRLAARTGHLARAGDPNRPPEEEVETADLDPGSIWDWSDDQLARAWHSRVLQRLPAEFWEDLAAAAQAGEEDE